MAKAKNFVNRDVRPQSATEADFDALFARHTSTQRSEAADVPIDRITPNPFQARQNFAGIDELAQAIRVQGFTTRLRVRRDPHDATIYQLVYGERRLRAAKAAGLISVPCEIAEHTDAELIEIGLAENIQRQDLDPLEEGQAFRTFMDQHGYTIVRLAERIGKDRSYVESRLALLRTPEDVQQLVAQRPDTIRAAREIAKLPTSGERRPLIEGVLSGQLSKEDVRALVRDSIDAPATEHTREESVQQRPAKQRRVQHGNIDERIEHDGHVLELFTARWEAQLATLSTPQRTRLLQVLDKHIEQLEQLLQLLREPQQRKRSGK